MRHGETLAAVEGSAPDSDTPESVDEPFVSLQRARAQLRAQAAALGGRSTLLHFDDTPDAGIDITKAHPGSLPQFLTGRPTLLSNLFRDEVALLTARRAAERVTAKHVEMRTVRGIDTVFLAVGMASWRIGGVACTAPVLLRPVAIRRAGNDFELKLHGALHVNPELVHASGTHFGIRLDGGALAALATEDGVFKPQPVIDHLRALTMHIPTFAVKPRLVVSNFAAVGSTMALDLPEREHLLLDALLGDARARERAVLRRERPAHVSSDDRAPASDVSLLDADIEQEDVLGRITAGHSFVVHTLPGSGGTQTLINALGELVRQGKRVLVVSARRATLDGIRHRLAEIGLDAFAVSPRHVRRDLVRAITRNEKATAPEVAEIDEALLRLRSVLKDYRAALTSDHPSLGTNALEVLRQLTRLAAHSPAPSTSARFDLATLERLRDKRTAAAERLAAAARLGEFRFGPDDSPWYGVSFPQIEDARSAHALAGRLSKQSVPSLLERGYELIAQTRMRPFRSIDELGTYLRLLTGIGQTLERFTRSIFDCPLDELIDAHASRAESGASAANRRRIRKHAREYLRPGAHVGDMHEALLQVRAQRNEWRRIAEAGAIPEIPLGLADVHVAWQRVDSDLTQLDRVLGRGEVDHLAALPLPQLMRTLAGLAAESEFFDNVVERARIRADLARGGLEPLLTDLSVRHVPESQVGVELEFAWWQSALEHLLRTDRALLGASTTVLERLEHDFRAVDARHVAASGPLLAANLATQWRIALRDHETEAGALRQALRDGVNTPGALNRLAPHLMRALSPVWLASPYEVPLMAGVPHVDVVLVADAGALCLAETAPAIRRARQVVVFGDPVTQRPTPFSVGSSSQVDFDEFDEPFDDRSLFERMGELTDVVTLTRSYRAGGEELADFVSKSFYGGEIVSLPWAGSYLGRESLTVEYVEGGQAAPDPVTGAIESPDAEVARVVALIAAHARDRANETLMVVTASARHAERVRSAVDAQLSRRSELAPFFAREGSEPFAVLTLEQSVAESRDRVIFSLGFGVTRHGRVLRDFGELSASDGDRLLTVGMTRARRSLAIVSAIRPEAVELDRLDNGAATLMTVLREMTSRDRTPRSHADDHPLHATLARELRALGVDVAVDYRGALPLVASAGGKAVVVESDPETRGATLREALRLRPQILRRLGWHYARVHAFDIYSEPAAVAAKIAAMLGITVESNSDITVTGALTEPVDVTR